MNTAWPRIGYPAIQLDAKLARAHVWLARVHAAGCWSGNSSDIERELQESQTAAECALALDDCDAECHYTLSILCLMTQRHDKALAAAQRAIDLNPTSRLVILRSARPASSWVTSPRDLIRSCGVYAYRLATRWHHSS
jgi:adenylate cyclase